MTCTGAAPYNRTVTQRKATPTTQTRWPEGAIVYHIYPRSFQDTNGDGIGDLPGITKRLPYLKTLGVNAIWLSPFYPSPMADFGYDIADYCNVDPIFGSLDDFKTLLSSAHQHDINVIVDLVPNHTSDEHPWFTTSRSSQDNEKANWYIWRDGKPHEHDDSGKPLPPNNWRDVLTGGSAWQWDDSRQQYYLHSFDVKQPDLNWQNPLVRDAFKEVMRFWLDLGVDGFRVDAVYWMAKEPLFLDDPINPEYIEGHDALYYELTHTNSQGWPPIFAYLSEMCDVLKEPRYQDKPRFMVTEAYPERHNSIETYLSFYVGMDPAVAAPFNFEGVCLPWEATTWRVFLKRFHTALNQLSPLCVPSYAFGNHDQWRLATRLGKAAASSSAVLLLTLPGMAFIYYGEEIGMENVPIPPKYVHDPAARGGENTGRDPERTPMQWDASAQAGFTNGSSTWLPIASDYTTRNVAVESDDPASPLSLYRTLGTLRNTSKSLRFGDITILDHAHQDILMYTRFHEGDDRYLTVINFSDKPVTCELPIAITTLLVSSAGKPNTVSTAQPFTSYTLQPHEAILGIASLDS